RANRAAPLRKFRRSSPCSRRRVKARPAPSPNRPDNPPQVWKGSCRFPRRDRVPVPVWRWTQASPHLIPWNMATNRAVGQVEQAANEGLTRGLGLFDSTMLVAGSMIGTGIFIVSAEMAREIGSPGWLLVSWLITGVLTLAAALSYGELAAM